MTVTPVADPTVGNLATPVNSSYFSKAFLNALPAYRPALSPNRRGLEIGMAHGFFLYGPFTVCGPMRSTDYATTAGLWPCGSWAAAATSHTTLTPCGRSR